MPPCGADPSAVMTSVDSDTTKCWHDLENAPDRRNAATIERSPDLRLPQAHKRWFKHPCNQGDPNPWHSNHLKAGIKLQTVKHTFAIQPLRDPDKHLQRHTPARPDQDFDVFAYPSSCTNYGFAECSVSHPTRRLTYPTSM